MESEWVQYWSLFAMESQSMVDIASLWVLRKSIVAMESQWLLWKVTGCY
jgi:hypothetical protein